MTMKKTVAVFLFISFFLLPWPAQATRLKTVSPFPKKASWSDFDKAVRLYNTGSLEEAAALLDKIYKVKLSARQNQLVRFISGVAAYRLGDFAKVERCMAGPGKVPSSLQGYAYFFLGMAAFSKGEYNRARALLSNYLEVQKSGELSSEAALTRAQTLHYQGKDKDALAEFNQLLDGRTEGPAYLGMARIYEAQKAPDRARSHYRAAMQSASDKKVRIEAGAKYKELLVRSIERKGLEADKIMLVELLQEEWRLDEALALVEKYLSEGGSSGYINELTEKKGKLLYFSGRIKEASVIFSHAAGSKAARKDPSAAWLYARCLEKMGEWEKAGKAYLNAAEALPGPNRTNKALYYAGLMFLKEKDINRAQQAWDKLSASGKRKFEAKILFQKGLHYYGEQDWLKAAQKFGDLVNKKPKGDLYPASRYWKARALEAAGQKKTAARIYRTLFNSHQDYYYRLLAGQRLGLIPNRDQSKDFNSFQNLITARTTISTASFTPIAQPEPGLSGKNAWAYSGITPDRASLEAAREEVLKLPRSGLFSAGLLAGLARLKDLLEAGTFELAYLEVDDLNRITQKSYRAAARPTSKFTAKEKKEFNAGLEGIKKALFEFSSAYLAESENYSDFVRLQYRQFGRLDRDGDEQAARRRLFPLAFPRMVLEASNEYHLHPALLLSLIRTESFYQPEVTSPAGAHGLMQILPSTAQKIAARLGRATPCSQELYTPEINIKFGSWYLKALIDEFDGQIPLALASYNGGPFNVKRWLDQTGPVSMEEFIELIPFDQTRVYVKRIWGLFFWHRELFTGKPEGRDLEQTVSVKTQGRINF